MPQALYLPRRQSAGVELSGFSRRCPLSPIIWMSSAAEVCRQMSGLVIECYRSYHHYHYSSDDKVSDEEWLL